MKLLKIAGLSAFILFLHSSILGIPLADMKTCELPNGDKVKIRTTRNWYLLKGLSPHGSAWGNKDKKAWYVPKGPGQFRSRLASYRLGTCSNYGYVYGVINIKDMFKLPNTDTFKNGHLLMDKLSYYDYSDERDSYQEPPFKTEIISSKYAPVENTNEFLWFGLVDKDLFYEAPLSERVLNKIEGQYLVAAVWQSYSTDDGKTWSKPKVTKDAKLFVTGKTIKEQPGVAKDKGTLKYIGWF